MIPHLLLSSDADAASKTTNTVDRGRVREVAAILGDNPRAPGKPITDRATWERLAKIPVYATMPEKAEKYIKEPLPEQPDELYLEFSRNGTRTNWEKVAVARRGRLTPLVLAECVENKGRFLPAIEDLITTLCAERTWVLPAHDRSLDDFHGNIVTIDLFSSALGWNMAMADFLLADRLPSKTRELLRANVERRVLKSFRDMLHGRRKADHWLRCTNNWNAVCLAGVVGAAVAQPMSGEECAEYIAAAEHYSHFFLSGFTPDGYCSEGLGYWGYGFGHFVFLSELMRHATSGKIDMLSWPEARMPAAFPVRIQIVDSLAPAFADCSTRATASSVIMWLLNKRLQLGLSKYAELDWNGTPASLGVAMIYAFPAQDAHKSGEPPPADAVTAGVRTWFDSAGILIGRPVPGSKTHMAVALKGGNNAEHHNHNDIGSYVVACGNVPVMLDPGGETYTARTFSAQRYESNMLNSFGHPVPVCAGKLQRKGAEAHAAVLGTTFTQDADTLRLDIRSAYDCKELQRLERTFVYSRAGKGSLTISDVVEYSTPHSYGTALITLGKFEQTSSNTLAISSDGETVDVTIDTDGLPFDIKAEEIKENAPVHPTRIGINLREPVASAVITVTVECREP